MNLNASQLIELLKTSGFDEISHSNTKMYDHLVNTYKILKKWELQDYICIAGLYHSIYGTQSLKESNSISDSYRDKFKLILGNDSEKLIWLYTIIDKETFYNLILKDKKVPNFIINRDTLKRISIDEKDKFGLVHLFISNWLEIFSRERGKYTKESISILLYLSQFSCLEAVKDVYKIGKEYY